MWIFSFIVWENLEIEREKKKWRKPGERMRFGKEEGKTKASVKQVWPSPHFSSLHPWWLTRAKFLFFFLFPFPKPSLSSLYHLSLSFIFLGIFLHLRIFPFCLEIPSFSPDFVVPSWNNGLFFPENYLLFWGKFFGFNCVRFEAWSRALSWEFCS